MITLLADTAALDHPYPLIRGGGLFLMCVGAGIRKCLMAILVVVGLHFIPMGLAHGPLIVILGVLCVVNAAIGFRAEHIDWRVFGVTDALLKLGFGAWMFLAYPAFTYFG